MACTLWFIDDYTLYACCIIGISLISMILSLVETRRVSLIYNSNYRNALNRLQFLKQAQTLHDMVKTNLMVNVCRGKDIFQEMPSEKLVPGDLIEIPSNHESLMACDAILLNGTCIVNESMLTGESVPVIKSPLPAPENPNELYDVEAHKRSTVFNGTRVVQTRSYDKSRVLALVVRTGKLFQRKGKYSINKLVRVHLSLFERF